MSKKNFIVDSKEMKRLEKVNARVEFLMNRIESDLKELAEIDNNESWLRYLGDESFQITEEQNTRLAEIYDNIFYSPRYTSR